MLTIDALRAYGADVDDGLRRCMNNEGFYLRLVEKAAADPSFDKLKEAVESGDLGRGFELAHTLKGVAANLSLTPVETPVREITELLRNHTETDYGPYLERIGEAWQKLKALLA
ncbi:MAG: Hpt domain-containing protein [Clostridia bacterium]|nr:Hpt domain-containing protein [Clostridia bacterium]